MVGLEVLGLDVFGDYGGSIGHVKYIGIKEKKMEA